MDLDFTISPYHGSSLYGHEGKDLFSESLITISGAGNALGARDDIRTNGQSRIVRRANGSGTMGAVPFNETLLKGETIDDRWGTRRSVPVTGCFINRPAFSGSRSLVNEKLDEAPSVREIRRVILRIFGIN